jgi:outer membrane lipoprotein SlyB
MIRLLTALSALALVAFMPAREAQAQSNNVLGGALLGAGAGAIIGGAATGKAGGAVAGGVIGAAAGAIIASEMQPRGRRGAGYYWYDGRCWLKKRDGSYYRVSRSHCR